MYKKVISVVFCMFLIVAGMGPVYAKTTADAARLEVENAWKYGKGDGVNVALIDCGADLKDPMIRANVKGVYNSLIDSEKDSLRFYYLGNDWKKKVEHIGAKQTYD